MGKTREVFNSILAGQTVVIEGIPKDSVKTLASGLRRIRASHNKSMKNIAPDLMCNDFISVRQDAAGLTRVTLLKEDPRSKGSSWTILAEEEEE
jgi:ribosomal protein L6P/L9E